jgi:hypothetical protein
VHQGEDDCGNNHHAEKGPARIYLLRCHVLSRR